MKHKSYKDRFLLLEYDDHNCTLKLYDVKPTPMGTGTHTVCDIIELMKINYWDSDLEENAQTLQNNEWLINFLKEFTQDNVVCFIKGNPKDWAKNDNDDSIIYLRDKKTKGNNNND